MKVLLNTLISQPKFAKVLYWGKLVTSTGAAQVLVQIIGFVSGVLVIRLLPTHEYALYTLANTMLGTMTVLAGGGIASGVMAQGGKHWQNKTKFSAVMATGMDLRRKFAVFSLIVAVPLLVYLMNHHGASFWMITLITLSLIPAFFSALSGKLLEISQKINQNLIPLQKNQVMVNIGRLAINLIVLFLFPWAFIAVLANGLPQIWGNFNLRRLNKPYVEEPSVPDDHTRNEILAVVKRQLPLSIYYCISGQITIWIVSFLGSTSALAQIGGLGRFAVVFSLFNMVFSMLITPRFARLAGNKNIIVKRFLQLTVLMLVLILGIITFFSVFSEQILWILGSGYADLRLELILVAIGGCLTLLNQSTNQLLSSRGIVLPPVLFIPYSIIVQLSFAFILQLDQLTNVLYYSIFTSLAIYCLRVLYWFYSIYNRGDSV